MRPPRAFFHGSDRDSCWLVGLMALGTAACGPCGSPAEARRLCVAGPAPPKPQPDALSAAAEVRRALFFDKSLSATGAMSCATCHDPDHAYGPPNDLAVQLGRPRRAHGRDRAPYRRCATRSTRRPTPTCSTTPTASARRGRAEDSPGTGAPTRSPSRPGCRCSRPSRWRTPAPTTSSRKIARRALRGPVSRRLPRPSLDRHGDRAFDATLNALQGLPARGHAASTRTPASSTCAPATRSAGRSRPPRTAGTGSSSTPSAATAPLATTTGPG